MKKIRIQLNEDELIRDYNQLKSLKKVALLHNCSVTTIKNRLITLGIDVSINRYLPKQFLISDEEIKNRYLNGESLHDIAKDAQTTKSLMALRKRLNSMGIDTNVSQKKYSLKIHNSCKKYKLDEHVFDIIDTEEKAYWLGFLMADGYNHESKTMVALRIQGEDSEHLEKFKTFLQTDTPIYIFKYTTPISKIEKEYCELNVCSPIFSQSLAKQGCVQGKTYILEFPNIDTSLYSHFIRGYFDGDGCISIRQRNDRKSPKCKQIQFNIVGKEDVILKIQEIICNNTGVFKTKLRSPKNNFAKRISWTGRNVCKKILDYLYKDATIYLQRKYEKYLILSNSAE